MSFMRTLRYGSAVLLVTLAMGCGGGGSGVATESASADATTAGTPSADATDATDSAGDSGDVLPDADPSTYVGRNRAVNLIVMPDGSTPVVDIWARRSFQYAPILLAADLGYGEVSDWYGRPEGMSVVAVASGAGGDGDPVSELFSATADQQSTHLLMWDSQSQAAGGFLLEEIAPGSTGEFPAADPATGLVQLYAYQLKIHPLVEGESFELTLGGHPVDYAVGIEGIAGCAPQARITDQGFAPNILGGTQRVPLDLPPGTSQLTFHGWGSTAAECSDPSLIGPFPVTVEAGSRQWMLLHSPDGSTIESLILPVD
jgi:hypothetical protein